MNERIHHRPVRTQASFAQHRAALPRTVRSAFSHRKQRHRRAALQPKRLAKRGLRPRSLGQAPKKDQVRRRGNE